MPVDHVTEKIPDHEAEKASNSYLMSLVALIAGLPLPLVNLLATLIFYFSNRRSTYFVRWHCTQALLSQVALFFVNSIGFWWTVSIIFTSETLSSQYGYYILFAILFNIIEFFSTIYAAVQTRKGIHVQWWFFSTLTDALCPRHTAPQQPTRW